MTRSDQDGLQPLQVIAIYCFLLDILGFLEVYWGLSLFYLALLLFIWHCKSCGFGGLLPFILAVFFKLSRFDEKWSTRPHSMTNANMAKAMGPDKEQ